MKIIKHLLGYLCLLLLVSAVYPVLADKTKVQAVNYTDVDKRSINEESSFRKLWSLSQADWTRYKTLMQGIRGSISPANISPIEVLGTHARSDQERRKFAEIWATMRYDDATRILAFQAAYNVAYQKLYPNEQLIDTARLFNQQQSAAEVFKTGDRVLVFVKINECPECEQMTQKLIDDNRGKNNPIDIYFIDTENKKDDDKIRMWAEAQQIDKGRLKSGAITLNHDNGNLYRITNQVISPVPQMFIVNANHMKKIHY